MIKSIYYINNNKKKRLMIGFEVLENLHTDIEIFKLISGVLREVKGVRVLWIKL